MANSPMDRSIGALGRTASPPVRTPQSCRWGDATLYTTFPVWLSAWDAPWTCTHPAHTGPLDTTETCGYCRDWRPHERS
jgi:hypothetical protein